MIKPGKGGRFRWNVYNLLSKFKASGNPRGFDTLEQAQKDWDELEADIVKDWKDLANQTKKALTESMNQLGILRGQTKC